MAYDTIEVKPMTPRIGAEVFGVDLARPTNRQLAEIHAAFLEHQVLFFRGQALDPDSHKRFGRHFGELHVHPAAPGPEGHPEILPIHADAKSRHVNGEVWHSDVSCDAEPPLGSVLHLTIVPPVGGDTVFASMYAAYDALSERMKAYLDGLTALHDGERFYRGRYEDRGVDDAGKTYPRAIHPVIRTHPETGRKTIFVNRMFTTRIVGLARDESEAILGFLWEHCAKPEYQVRFRWAENSVAFWDNRAVQHQALWDYFPHTRSGLRVTIKGDAPR
ncbi:MAG: TauD/TfdA family dioxygenase [Rhodospirillales bacterium]|nr:TauD/TfdA family dioxygenase [Rhodospirillales bacterium]MDE2200602.1 TauD/TfdA family dioxygenase [Rhodospirillales bacterium]MDE2575983.1 TauD/TfdA family dioxygenase [Rhodospirillales bacterium]